MLLLSSAGAASRRSGAFGVHIPLDNCCIISSDHKEPNIMSCCSPNEIDGPQQYHQHLSKRAPAHPELGESRNPDIGQRAEAYSTVRYGCGDEV